MKSHCRWDEWNRNHILKHRVSVEEAEYVLLKARPPYPRGLADGKFLVWGQTAAGRYLQVIFVHDSDEKIDFEKLTANDILSLPDDQAPRHYVVHARDLSRREKRQHRHFK